MSATSSCTRATAAGQTRIIRSIALAGRLGHRVLHPPVGVALEAEQLGAVGAQLHDLGDDRVGVVGIAIVAAVDERAPHLLAKRAVVGEGQHRIDRRARVADRIAAGGQALASLAAAAAASFTSCRNAVHLGLGRRVIGALVGEQLRLKSEKADGELLVDTPTAAPSAPRRAWRRGGRSRRRCASAGASAWRRGRALSRCS